MFCLSNGECGGRAVFVGFLRENTLLAAQKNPHGISRRDFCLRMYPNYFVMVILLMTPALSGSMPRTIVMQHAVSWKNIAAT